MNESLFKQKSKLWIAAATILIALLTYTYLIPTYSEAARRTVAIFIIAVGFWAFEVIPLYATSLVIVIGLSFFLTHGTSLLGEKTYNLFLIPLSSPVIMLFLGGFTIAAALRKHEVDAFLIKRALRHFGNRPPFLLFGFLFLTAFFSMWLSNTITTAIFLIMAKPIFEELDKKDPFRKALVLAIAFGATIGGMATPVGTPPNAIGVGLLAEKKIYVDFLMWMEIAFPITLVLLFIAGFLLLLFFRPHTKRIVYPIPEKKSLSKEGIQVLGISCFIIFLWLSKGWNEIPEAIVALLAIALFAAFNLIDVKDIRSLPWDILILMWGGLALGKGVEESGLIHHLIQIPFFDKPGFEMIVAFSVLALLLTTFMSDTATAILILPLALSITEHDQVFVTIILSLASSFAFSFPISTPPNAMAFSTHLFSTRDIFKVGSLLSMIALVLLFIVLYLSMALGFKTTIA